MINLIWCPSIDQEMRNNMASFTHSFPSAYKTALEGGQRQLGSFDPMTHKLYIIAHGHKQMPVFCCNSKSWTAGQLVDLLHSDGLPPTWREIELLVCYAGESVNTVKVGNKLLAIREEARAVGAGSNKIDHLKDKFNKVAKKGQDPSPFTSEDQLLPLAAQFVHSLKTHNPPYTNFIVTSFAAPVAQNFSEGSVTLDLEARGGKWGEPLTKHRHLIKIWH